MQIPQNIRNNHIETQLIKIHLSPNKHIHITNIYIPSRGALTQQEEDTLIKNTFDFLTGTKHNIITGDVNAHSTLWHSTTDDHRGETIADLILESDHIILNENKPTRKPNNADQQDTSPDITTIHTDLYTQATWDTLTELSSDHLPILITLNTKTNFRLTQSRSTFTNYNKADWTLFTQEIEEALHDVLPPQNIHTDTKTLTNIILNADKHHIPKGKIRNTEKLLPQEIRDKIQDKHNQEK